MSTAVASALGFARFAYALVLPAMKASLHWNYFEAGSLNIANALGYMIGALAAARLAKIFGTKKLFLTSLFLITIFTLAPALNSNLILLLIERGVSGVFGATILVTGGALVAHGNSKQPRRIGTTTLGIYFGGAGLGIVISGSALPSFITYVGNQRWPLVWVLLAAFCLLALIANCFVTQNLSDPTQPKDTTETVPMRNFRPSFIAYGTFGAGYISFMTFVIAFLKQQGSSESFITLFYITLGLSALVSAFFWDRPLEALSKGYGLGATLTSVAIGSALPFLGTNHLFDLLSAFFFGFALMATSTAITRIAQRNAPPSNLTAILGWATFYMGVGQSLGPLITGALSDTPSGLKLGMQVASMACALAIAIALLQKDAPSSPISTLSHGSIGT